MTFRQKVGELVKKEMGKSEVRMGDAMTLVYLVFDRMLADPEFMAKGFELAAKRLKINRRLYEQK